MSVTPDLAGLAESCFDLWWSYGALPVSLIRWGMGLDE